MKLAVIIPTLATRADLNGAPLQTDDTTRPRLTSELFFFCSFSSPAQLQRWFGKCLQMSPVPAQRHHVSSPTWNVSGLESRAEKRTAYFPCQLTWRGALWGRRGESRLILLFSCCWETQIRPALPEFKEIPPKYQIDLFLLLILQSWLRFVSWMYQEEKTHNS